MNDTEEAARRVFAVAVEDVPPGIDLLRGVRARSPNPLLGIRAVAAAGAAGVVRGTVQKVEITFGDFGLPVSVSPPPAGGARIPPAG